MAGEGVRRDDLSFLEQIIWASYVAQFVINNRSTTLMDVWTTADRMIERLRDEDHRRCIERTAGSVIDASFDDVPLRIEDIVDIKTRDRGPRMILEDIGFLPRPADPEDQGDDDLNH